MDDWCLCCIGSCKIDNKVDKCYCWICGYNIKGQDNVENIKQDQICCNMILCNYYNQNYQSETKYYNQTTYCSFIYCEQNDDYHEIQERKQYNQKLCCLIKIQENTNISEDSIIKQKIINKNLDLINKPIVEQMIMIPFTPQSNIYYYK